MIKSKWLFKGIQKRQSKKNMIGNISFQECWEWPHSWTRDILLSRPWFLSWSRVSSIFTTKTISWTLWTLCLHLHSFTRTFAMPLGLSDLSLFSRPSGSLFQMFTRTLQRFLTVSCCKFGFSWPWQFFGKCWSRYSWFWCFWQWIFFLWIGFVEFSWNFGRTGWNRCFSDGRS